MVNVNYHKIEEIIRSSSNVYVMGHKGIDLDAFGACLGLYYIINSFNKKCFIILDEEESDTSIIKTKEELNKKNYNILQKKYLEIENTIDDEALLIIVDANYQSLLQNPCAIDKFKKIIILDHHKENQESIPNVIYKYIDENYSSTCEIILNLIKKYQVEIPDFIASIMLGGIVVDTNNFTLKTSDTTYENASYLTKIGGDTKEVQYLLKENLKEYFNIQKIIENVIIIDDKYAICTCDNTKYDKEFLAKIASTLLSFDGIEVSFAIGKLEENIVGISSRSIGNLDASIYMKKLGGGGHTTNAACQIANITINDTLEKLLNIIKEG